MIKQKERKAEKKTAIDNKDPASKKKGEKGATRNNNTTKSNARTNKRQKRRQGKEGKCS